MTDEGVIGQPPKGNGPRRRVLPVHPRVNRRARLRVPGVCGCEPAVHPTVRLALCSCSGFHPTCDSIRTGLSTDDVADLLQIIRVRIARMLERVPAFPGRCCPRTWAATSRRARRYARHRGARGPARRPRSASTGARGSPGPPRALPRRYRTPGDRQPPDRSPTCAQPGALSGHTRSAPRCHATRPWSRTSASAIPLDDYH